MNLAETLAAIPEAYANLPGYLLPGSQPPDPEKRTAHTVVSHRSILRLEVVDLLDVREKADASPTRDDFDVDRRAGARRQGILPTLSSWVRLVDSEMWDEGDEHQNPPTQRTVAGECAWLASQLEWIEAQRWVGEIEEDLARMLADMLRACGVKPEPVYRCPNCRDLVRPEDKGAWYRCLGCGQTWAMHNEINRLLAQQANTMTLKACAEDVGRPKSSLEEWRARGLINPVAKDDRGRFLFDVECVRRISETVGRRERKPA